MSVISYGIEKHCATSWPEGWEPTLVMVAVAVHLPTLRFCLLSQAHHQAVLYIRIRSRVCGSCMRAHAIIRTCKGGRAVVVVRKGQSLSCRLATAMFSLSLLQFRLSRNKKTTTARTSAKTASKLL